MLASSSYRLQCVALCPNFLGFIVKVNKNRAIVSGWKQVARATYCFFCNSSSKSVDAGAVNEWGDTIFQSLIVWGSNDNLFVLSFTSRPITTGQDGLAGSTHQQRGSRHVC